MQQQKKHTMMTFEDIKQDGRLWAFIMPMKLKMS